MATNPGVRISKGRAELNSKSLIDFITQKNATAFNRDLKNRIDRLVSEGICSIEIKKGITKTRFIKARKAENSNAFSLKRIFFSRIAANAEKRADSIAIIVQFIF